MIDAEIAGLLRNSLVVISPLAIRSSNRLHWEASGLGKSDSFGPQDGTNEQLAEVYLRTISPSAHPS